MDVKYVPADWEKMRAGLSDLLAQGFGAGLFDHLKDVNEVLEDAERDIAKYDVDGAISFHHTSQKSLYNSLSDDFSVLHRFTGKVGDIVDRTIDEPFYKDMDAFVQAVRDLSISTYTTNNRIGAKETVNYGYGATATQVEVPKTEVSIDDLLSGGNFYAHQIKQEYNDWKTVNPDQELSEDEYRMAAVNMRAFEYESIRDQQDNKEFWVGIASLVVIVGVSLVCPPAGIALGAAYGVMEVSSAVSGEDWVSGRELSTSERWTRGLLAPLDIIPAVGAVSKFAKGARLAQLGGHMGQLGAGVRTAGATIAAGTQRVRHLANSASNFATTRLRNATNALNDAKNIAVNKVERELVDVGRAVDTGITWTKNNLNLGRQVVTPEGFVFKETFENKHTYENNLKDFLSRFEGINLKPAGTGAGSTSVNGTKSLVGNGEHFTNGRKNRLKPNIRYKTGEYDYFYETDNAGRIIKFETEELQLTTRTDRLPHSKNTLGKVKGQDHAGHLAGDRFGGSPKLDNLVSQLSDVNLKQYKSIEDEWATALKETPPKEVKVNVEIKYDGNNSRPSEFIVNYEIDGDYFEINILN